MANQYDSGDRETCDVVKVGSDNAAYSQHEDEGPVCTNSCDITNNKTEVIYQKRQKMTSLQKITSPKWALAFLSIAYFFSDSVINGVFPVSISSVEKQFQLTTTESGLIASMIDIGACLALVPSIYFGENIFKPRWIGVGVFLSGLGSLIYSIPQFVSPTYQLGEEITNFCGNVSNVDCTSSSPLKNYRFIFMLGMTLCGIGTEYALTIGVSYLDENVKQKFSSTYHGIFYCGGALGTAVGYFLTGLTLRVFTYPEKSLSIDISDPLWVGAWWLGFIIGGSALLCASVPILTLPRLLKGAEVVQINREQKKSGVQPNRTTKFRRRLVHLMKNKLFILLAISVIIHKALLYGFMTYGVKIGVELYGLTESLAAFGLGSLAIFSSVIGFALGGVIVTKFDLSLRGIIIFVFGCYVISFPPTFGFLLQCPQRAFAGVKLPSEQVNVTEIAQKNLSSSILNSCNSFCGCDTDLYAPVCDDNGITYFSPCHAGCSLRINQTDFGDCTCLVDSNSTVVSSSKCNESVCGNLYPVTAILFISFFSGFLTSTPSTQAILRSVGFDERTMALSIMHIGILLGGRMLGRLVFSQGLGSACLVSSTECGEAGACRSFDGHAATWNIAMIMASGKMLSIICVGFAWIIHRKKSKAQEEV